MPMHICMHMHMHMHMHMQHAHAHAHAWVHLQPMYLAARELELAAQRVRLGRLA
jgi:hypothetical protein